MTLQGLHVQGLLLVAFCLNSLPGHLPSYNLGWKKLKSEGEYGCNCLVYQLYFLDCLLELKICLESSWERKLLIAELCPTLCDPIDCSLPGSSIPGILQTRILEWIAIPFSRGSSQPRDWTPVSYISCIGQLGSLPLAPLGKPYLLGYWFLYSLDCKAIV